MGNITHDERGDGSPRPATDVIAANAIPAVAAIGTGLEGRTARQQNPRGKGSLAWLAWIVARLGGWICSDRPPGPKTMSSGWRRLAERLQSVASHRQTAPRTGQENV